MLTGEPNPWAVGMYHGAFSEPCVGGVVCEYYMYCKSHVRCVKYNLELLRSIEHCSDLNRT